MQAFSRETFARRFMLYIRADCGFARTGYVGVMGDHAGKRLARWRKEHGMNQSALATVLGTSPDTVRAMEQTGSARQYPLIVKLAALTKIPITDWTAPPDEVQDDGEAAVERSPPSPCSTRGDRGENDEDEEPTQTEPPRHPARSRPRIGGHGT